MDDDKVVTGEEALLVRWLKDVAFGRRTATEDEERSAVRRIGDIRQSEDD